MRITRNRRVACMALGLLVVVVMLPNALWLWFSLHQGDAPTVQLVLAACLMLLWFAVFGRVLWLGCLLLAPLALLAPAELYYIAAYHLPSSVPVLKVVFATSPAETHQFVGGMLIPLVVACLACFCVALLAAWLAWRSGLRWRGPTHWWLACVVALLVVYLPVGYSTWGRLSFQTTAQALHSAKRAGLHEAKQFIKWLSPGYPFGLPERMAEFVYFRHQAHVEVAKLAAFRFGAHLATPLPSHQIYVLVIGESSQRGHWQLFGYSRPTTPELSSMPNVVPIRRMVSAFTQTSLAVPVMLTRKPPTWPGHKAWSEASIVRAMSEAGFNTWWISNQYEVSRNNSVIAVYAHEAKHLRWMNQSDWNAHGNDDGDLIAPLRKAIRASSGNVFIVLHTLGSHLHYDYRYPPAFARFKPTVSDKSSTAPHWQRVTNSYDNTIVYTDHVLAQIIGVLKARHATTALWYASDHGDTLPSPTCHAHYHGHEFRPEYQIPVFFWYSNAYAKAFPQRVATLRAHADVPTMSEDEFPTLVDMAGVDFPSHTTHEDRSLFSPAWKPHTRWVNEFWTVDFDHANVGPGCQKLTPAASAAEP